MNWHPTVYSVVPAVAAAAAAGVFGLAWRHRSRSLAVPFMWMVAAVACWSAADAVQLGFESVGVRLFWERVGTSVSVFIPALWLVVASHYSGRGEYVSRRVLALLAVEPLAMVALTWAAPDLLWTVEGLSRGSGPTVLELTFQPAYFVHIAYSYLLLGVGVVLILDVLRRPSRLYRKQAAALVVGMVLPTAANVAFTLGVSPVPGLDLTTFTFAISAVVVGLALFEYDLLDLAPVAHRGMLEELDAGIVVLDAEDRVVEYNAAAGRILDPPPTVGDPPGRSFPAGIDDLDGTVLEAPVDGLPRYYDVRVSSISDHHGRNVGRFVGLIDVTGLREREQRLTVANRLLRHNLRNSVSVIDGYAQRLAESVDDEELEHVRTIREEALRLASLGEEAREMVRTLDRDPRDQMRVEATAAVERAIGDLRRNSHGAVVETDLPTEAWLRAVDRRSVEVAVENLVENAIQHNDAREPWVHVSVSTGPATGDAAPPSARPARGRDRHDDGSVAAPNGGTTPEDCVRIRVADDGPGIPNEERQVLVRETETPLEHGSGLGLWIVYWVVHTSGGGIAIEDREPRGTVVTLTFPRAAPAESEDPGPG